MEAAIVGASIGVTLGIAIILLVRAFVSSMPAALEREATATRGQLKAEASQLEAERQRDAALVDLAREKKRADDAVTALATTQKQLANSAAQLVTKVSREVVTADAPQVLSIVNDLLNTPIVAGEEKR